MQTKRIRKVVLILVLLALLATPASASNCVRGGNGRKVVCACYIAGHWRGVPCPK